jgi:DnaJ-class molecular chaperone
MPVVGRNSCLECEGTGKCADCNGTGINIHLNAIEPNCEKCAGTGICEACKGTGRWYVPPPEIQDIGFDKL